MRTHRQQEQVIKRRRRSAVASRGRRVARQAGPCPSHCATRVGLCNQRRACDSREPCGLVPGPPQKARSKHQHVSGCGARPRPSLSLTIWCALCRAELELHPQPTGLRRSLVMDSMVMDPWADRKEQETATRRAKKSRRQQQEGQQQRADECRRQCRRQWSTGSARQQLVSSSPCTGSAAARPQPV